MTRTKHLLLALGIIATCGVTDGVLHAGFSQGTSQNQTTLVTPKDACAAGTVCTASSSIAQQLGGVDPTGKNDSAYVSPYGGTTQITGPDGVCWQVTNNRTDHAIYVPARYVYEWEHNANSSAGFLTHLESSVTVAPCNQCGSSYLGTFSTTPTTGLCGTGSTASAVTLSGSTYSWTCTPPGTSTTCTATYSAPSAPVTTCTGPYVWTQRTAAGQRNWGGLAMSSDGTKLVAGDTNNGSSVNYNGGYIYTSADGGVTWTQQTGTGAEEMWGRLAISSDGTKLAGISQWVSGSTYGYIYTSADSGVTWTPTGAYGQNWSSIASSSDGTRLALTAQNENYIYTSANSGTAWTTEGTFSANHYPRSIAMSSDGTKLAAVTGTNVRVSGDGDYIFTSTNSGANWTMQTGPGSKTWMRIASSSDGTRLAATAYSPSNSSSSGDYIYTSADSGATWTQRTGAGAQNWNSIASSSDGTMLMASGGGYIYTSADGGATWTQQTTPGSQSWGNLAMSSDGTKLAAASDGTSTSSSYVGYIWTASCTGPAAGTCGSASGVGASSAPASNLCGDGSIPAVTQVGSNWTWTCAGNPPSSLCTAPVTTSSVCTGSETTYTANVNLLFSDVINNFYGGTFNYYDINYPDGSLLAEVNTVDKSENLDTLYQQAGGPVGQPWVSATINYTDPANSMGAAVVVRGSPIWYWSHYVNNNSNGQAQDYNGLCYDGASNLYIDRSISLIGDSAGYQSTLKTVKFSPCIPASYGTLTGGSTSNQQNTWFTNGSQAAQWGGNLMSGGCLPQNASAPLTGFWPVLTPANDIFGVDAFTPPPDPCENSGTLNSNYCCNANLPMPPAWPYPTTYTGAQMNYTPNPVTVNGVTLPNPSNYYAYFHGDVCCGNNYPTITGAANNGAGLVRLTVNSTIGLYTGSSVTVYSVKGTTEANGTWTVTVVDGTHIDLQGSHFVHTFTAGGGPIVYANDVINACGNWQSWYSNATCDPSVSCCNGQGNCGGGGSSD